MQFKLESTVLFDSSFFKVKRPIYLPFEDDESLRHYSPFICHILLDMYITHGL